MEDVTDEQWRFVDETISDFKLNLRLLAERRRENEIEQHLVFWAIYLGVFAIETYEGIAMLIRGSKYRAAFMLGRALIEYHIRLRYYLLQSAPLLAGMREHPEVDKEIFYRQATAITDWKNADPKMAALLHHRLSVLSAEDRAAVLAIVAENETLYERNFSQMRELVSREDSDVSDFALVQFKMQSAFLHGDQAALSDAVEFRDKRLVVHLDSPAIKGMMQLAEASLFVTEVLASLGRAHGWSYGGIRANRRVREVFLAALSANVAKVEKEEAARAAERQA